jgi:PKD repeat protein
MGRIRGILAILAVLVAALGGAAAGAPAASADIGTEDFGYAPFADSPTGSKPESKLWFADGEWWATMYHAASTDHRIFRLNRSSQTWADTQVTLDDRPDTRADTLWHAASGKLYVASHVWSRYSGSPASAANGARLYRFSYDAASDRYTRDAGFPVNINNATSETLTLDQDSTGALWATWTQGSRVYVNHTTGSDSAWGTPYILPGSTALDADDISSLVHFGGDRIGVMWDNEADNRTYFAVHADGTGDSAASWSVATVPTGWNSDDHINLKADSGGRVYAATKTSDTSGSEPLILLNVRATTGAWSTYVVSRYSDDNTRAIVQIDEQHGLIHLIMTCGNTGGYICRKTSPIGSISFGSGSGTAIIRDDSSFELNDATSTKREISGATGLVVMANDPDTDVYWHTDLSLGAPSAPVSADFTATPTSGGPPLSVAFRDASSGLPTSWLWSFGDGETSIARNPSHNYAAAGTYTVSLTAASTAGTDTRTRTGLITVGSPATPPADGGGAIGSAGAGASGADETGGGSQAGAPTPGGTVLGTSTLGRRTTITLRKTGLGAGRVRLSGAVKPRLSGVRVSLQRRDSKGRWSTLRRARLQPLIGGRSRYAFVVGRKSLAASYRIVVPQGSGRPRALSAVVRVARR